ncbi:Hydrolase-4 domain-containing protein [Fusarium falciforme]|uniref:Hydrolase-4 domain-containing protein n=1 Tax=Fusarium falciforme TaxID=195108 RepID=UPI00230114DC|nr:Hydrolase-4 domain-containing protein [Fusarium falciforme]WAO86957.1 Hydrolase-4 domain-containing protein [Fusarium falciforme]
MRFLLPLIGLLGAACAQQNICDTTCQKGCDAACQAAIQGTYESESKLWVSDIVSDPFYSTPANISSAKPGDILRWEAVPAALLSRNWTIPASLSLYRFMYATEDINNSTIPATAWALLPFHRTLSTPGEPRKLRTVVWTHGTAGRSRLCSTTNNRGLYYDWKAPFILAESGYAVIAPDYSGQGSDIPQGFMYEAGFLHAADVAYSVVAARKVIGSFLSRKWAVFGHSEGGMTAWRTAERLARKGEERLLKAGEFIGAVAAAPALRPQKLIPLSWKQTGTGGGPFSVYFLQSLAKLFPKQIKVEDYLADVTQQRLQVLDNSCFQTGFAAVGTLSPEQLFKNTSWLQHPATNEWAVRYNGQGPYPLAAPLLVIQGVNDTITPAVLTMEDFNLTCSSYPKSPIHAKLYPEMGHGQVLESARADIEAWLDARFNGKPAGKACSIDNIEPLTENYARGELFWAANIVPF